MADYDSSLPVRTETDGDIGAVIVDKVTPANSWDIDANGAGLVTDANGNLSTLVTDGTDVLEINSDGSINVIIQDEAITSGEVHEYGTVSAGIPGTINTVVDYTVTALKTLRLKSFQASASGKFKAELQVGPTGSEVTVATVFGSTSDGVQELTFPNAIEVAAGDKVLVVVTNNDKANADVYAYINGIEL